MGFGIDFRWTGVPNLLKNNSTKNVGRAQQNVGTTPTPKTTGEEDFSYKVLGLDLSTTQAKQTEQTTKNDPLADVCGKEFGSFQGGNFTIEDKESVVSALGLYRQVAENTAIVTKHMEENSDFLKTLDKIMTA